MWYCYIKKIQIFLSPLDALVQSAEKQTLICKLLTNSKSYLNVVFFIDLISLLLFGYNSVCVTMLLLKVAWCKLRFGKFQY